MPRLKSHSGSGGLLLSHGSSSRRILALKLFLLGMGGCALLAAVYLPGRETGIASENIRESNMRTLMGDTPAEADLLGASPARDDVIPPPDSSTAIATITMSSSSITTVAVAPTPSAAPALLLFPADAQLRDLTGALINANEALAGKSVGLYFGAGWCSMTRAANPGVSAWITAREADGVTLVYVSSDMDAAGLTQQQTENGWPFAVPHDSPLRTSLKEKYRVWSMHEDKAFKGRRVSGIPTMMVVGKDGEEMARLDVGMKGVDELAKWNYVEWKWE
ncbi:hypothetical protein VYU27_008448 [Nannochloropsis oceanica]